MTGVGAMIMLDQTGVSVALPDMQTDLSLGQADVQWIVNAYILALAALVAVGGRIGDMFGRFTVFVIGVAIFTAASVVVGVAGNTLMLLGGRAAEGAGAALMIPTSSALVVNSFDISQRGKAMSVYAGISLVFLGAGPLIAGALTEFISWRSVFFVNVPVAAICLAIAFIAKPVNERQTGARFDFKGAPLLIAGLAILVLGFMRSQTVGWGSFEPYVQIAVGLALLVAFLFVERRSASPLIPIPVLKIRAFVSDISVLLLVQFALVGVSVYMVIWLQRVLDLSPLAAGAAQMPLVIPLIAISIVAGRLFDRFGARVIVILGTSMAALGMFSLAIAVPERSYPLLVPGMILLGAGIAFTMVPANTDALNRVPVNFRAGGSGIIQTFRQMGGTIGIAITGSVAAAVESTRIASTISKLRLSPSQSAQATETVDAALNGNESALAALSTAELDGLKSAMSDGVSTGFYVSTAALLGAVAIAVIFSARGRQTTEVSDVVALG